MISKNDILDHEAAWPEAEAGREVVLHARAGRHHGGADRSILLSASYLSSSPYWLAAAYIRPADDPGMGSVRRRAEELHCPLVEVGLRGVLGRGVLRQLLKLCRYYQVRIWHGHDYKSNMLGLMLRAFWPMKLVATVHGDGEGTLGAPLWVGVDRWCLPYYDRVVCSTRDLINRVLSMGVVEDRCVLIPNAVDEKRFSRCVPAECAALRESGPEGAGELREGCVVIGSVGRLTADKGLNGLIRAVGALVHEGLDIELWLAGEGEVRDELEVLIEHLGLEGRVRLLGYREDMCELYEAMDVFVHAGMRGGVPCALLEAMSMGVAVVSTEVEGLSGVIDGGETGLVSPIGHIDALVGALRRVVADKELRRGLAERGRSRVERELGFSKRMAKIKAVYDGLLGDGPGEPVVAGVSMPSAS